MNASKTKTRLYHSGEATYRRVARDRGWGGPWGQTRMPARWACIDCGRVIYGSDDRPNQPTQWDGSPDDICQRNGHAPCWACGKQLPRLNCGCPREHNWQHCPGKTEANRMVAQHAASHHRPRQEPAQGGADSD